MKFEPLLRMAGRTGAAKALNGASLLESLAAYPRHSGNDHLCSYGLIKNVRRYEHS